MRTKLVAIAVFGVVLLAGILIVATGSKGDGEFCTMEGILEDMPDGWDLARDSFNDCQWTLFNAAGDRAPASLYATIPFDPPSPPPVNRPTTGYALIVIGLSGMIAGVVLWIRQERDFET